LAEARRQKEAVEAIRKRGGYVLYDYQRDAQLGVQAPVPTWLRELFGDDFLCDVVLADVVVDDQFITALVELPRPDALLLHGTQLTDTGLAHLKGLPNLEGLSIESPHVTDAGLEHVAELTKISWLNLSETAVTDAGLETLAELKNLHSLDVRHTKVTVEGVKELQQALSDCKVFY
jgi:hypothetical protein